MASSLFSLFGEGEDEEGVDEVVLTLEAAEADVEVNRVDSVLETLGAAEDIITTAAAAAAGGVGLVGSLEAIK